MDNDIWVCSLNATGPSGEAIVNVVKCSQDASGLGPTAPQVATAVDAIVPALLCSATTEDYRYSHTTVKNYVGGALYAEATTFNNTGTTGGHAATQLPLMVTALLQLKSGHVGRHGRGRMYVSPIPDAWVDVNGYFDITQADVINLGGGLVAGFAAGGVAMHFGVSSAANISFFAFESFTVGELAGQQRRRRVRLPN